MRRLGPVLAAGAALVTLALLAGVTSAAPTATGPDVVHAATSKAKSGQKAKKAKRGTKARSRRAVRKKRALKRCRTIKRKHRRRACVTRVHRRFRQARPHKPAKPRKPVFDGATYHVEVGDDFFSPTELTINSGDAVVWQWNPVNKDDHNVSMYLGPKGVDPLDFEMADAPAVGPDWRRVFKVRGTYVMGCSLHHLQRITIKVK